MNWMGQFPTVLGFQPITINYSFWGLTP